MNHDDGRERRARHKDEVNHFGITGVDRRCRECLISKCESSGLVSADSMFKTPGGHSSARWRTETRRGDMKPLWLLLKVHSLQERRVRLLRTTDVR